MAHRASRKAYTPPSQAKLEAARPSTSRLPHASSTGRVASALWRTPPHRRATARRDAKPLHCMHLSSRQFCAHRSASWASHAPSAQHSWDRRPTAGCKGSGEGRRHRKATRNTCPSRHPQGTLRARVGASIAVRRCRPCFHSARPHEVLAWMLATGAAITSAHAALSAPTPASPHSRDARAVLRAPIRDASAVRRQRPQCQNGCASIRQRCKLPRVRRKVILSEAMSAKQPPAAAHTCEMVSHYRLLHKQQQHIMWHRKTSHEATPAQRAFYNVEDEARRAKRRVEAP